MKDDRGEKKQRDRTNTQQGEITTNEVKQDEMKSKYTKLYLMKRAAV